MATTATTAAIAAIAATWVSAATQLLLLRRPLAALVPPGPRIADFREWLAVSLPLLVISGSELVLQNADILAVSRYMTPADVGVYFAAAKTMGLILFVHYAVGSAVANRFAALHARGAKGELEQFVRDAVRWTFWPSFACALLVLALGRPLLALFGPQFVDGYPVMVILVAGFLVRASVGPSEFILNMLGEQRRCAVVVAFSAVLDIALNVVLVPEYGRTGAALATSLAFIVGALLNARIARRRLGLDITVWAGLRQRRKVRVSD